MTLAGHNDASGGLFALCWGLFATVMGGLLVTDFRGFTRWFVRTAEARGPWRRQSRPSQQAGRLVLVRVIGGIFAVVGPVMLVVGVVLTAQGHAGSLFQRVERPGGAFAFVYPVVAAVWLLRFWRPGGRLSATWKEGRGGPRALTVLITAGVVGLAVAWFLGFPALGFVPFVAAGLALLFLEFRNFRRGDGPDPASRTETAGPDVGRGDASPVP